MKAYVVSWDTKQFRKEYHHEQIFEAENAKEARKAFDHWYGQKIARAVGTYPHAFHIKVKLAASVIPEVRI